MFVDIHTHILPNIDDGAKDMNMTNEMLRIADQNGTSHIIATPHLIGGYNHHINDIESTCVALNSDLKKKYMNLTIHSGCEVFISPELIGLYDNGLILTLAGSRYMLIELPMLCIPAYSDTILYELQLKGIIPIIAHPERNQEIQDDPERLRKLVKRGVLVQINASSLSGLHGKLVSKKAIQMIKMGLVHFVASDAHTNRNRSPDLTQSADMVMNLFSQELMELLFIHNGMKLLQNKSIEPVHPPKSKKGSWLW